MHIHFPLPLSSHQDYTTDLQLKTVQLTESGVALVSECLRADSRERDGGAGDEDDVFDATNSFAL